MRFSPLLQATAAVLLAACNPITSTCTLIGCQDGLQVQLASTPSGAYRVEVWADTGRAPQVFECGAGQVCPPTFFTDLVAERVTIRVVTAAGTRTQEFTPVYENVYPNGRRCGGACKQATVTFSQ